jgi:hypothetical protein
MKTRVKISLTVICFMVFGILTLLQAQEAINTAQQTNFGIRAAGVSAGWYNPSMDYWNDTYFKDNGWDNKFKGSAYYGAFFEVNVIKDLRARVGFSYWKETVKSGEIQIGGFTGNEKLAISHSSICIDALYNLKFLSFEKFKPYCGIGGNFVFVQAKITKNLPDLPEETTKKQGQDFTGSIILGIERPIFRHLSAGIEFNYIFGKYIQKVKDDYGNSKNNDVMLSGHKIGISIYYVF